MRIDKTSRNATLCGVDYGDDTYSTGTGSFGTRSGSFCGEHVYDQRGSTRSVDGEHFSRYYERKCE